MSRSEELQEMKGTLKEMMGEAPELKKFSGFMESAEAPDALDTKTKELMSLAIGVAVKCEGCILWHTEAALDAGATHDEIVDALKVAVVMGGGPALVHAVEAYETLLELEQQRDD